MSLSFQALKYLVICYSVTDNWNRFPPPFWDTAFQVCQGSSQIQWSFFGSYLVWSSSSIPSRNTLFPWLLWPLTLLAFPLHDCLTLLVPFTLSFFVQPLNLGIAQSGLGPLSPFIPIQVSLGDFIQLHGLKIHLCANRSQTCRLVLNLLQTIDSYFPMPVWHRNLAIQWASPNLHSEGMTLDCPHTQDYSSIGWRYFSKSRQQPPWC